MQIKYDELPTPAGWNKERIGKRLKLNYGKSQAAIKTDDGTIPIYGTGGLMGYGNRALTDGDSVLIGRKGTLGNPLYIGQPFWPVDTTYYTSDFDGSTKWFYYMMQTIGLPSLNEATGVPSLSRQTLSNVAVLFPPPEQQTAIADILTTVDQAIEQTEALIAKQRRIKAGLLHDLLTRGIDEHGRLRDPSTHRFKESPVGLVPEEWEVKKITEVLTFPTGQIDPRQLPYLDWPLVAPDHIEQGTGRLLEVKTAREQGAISGKYCFMPGDVVYSKIRPYLRKAILAEFQGLCSADMYPLRPMQNITPGYLHMLILGEHFSRFAEAVSERSGFPKINRQEMSGYSLVLPKLSEQSRIEGVFSTLADLQHENTQQLAKLLRLKAGLMQDLLSGQVLVTGFVAGLCEITEDEMQLG